MKKNYLLLIAMLLFGITVVAQQANEIRLKSSLNPSYSSNQKVEQIKKLNLQNSFISNGKSSTHSTSLKNFNFLKSPKSYTRADFSVYYPRPIGVYLAGLDEKGNGYIPLFLAPAREYIPFYVYSNDETKTATYNWTVNNGSVSLDELTETDGTLNFEREVPGLSYYMPELNGKLGTASATYKYGSEEDRQFFLASDHNNYPLTNADHNTGGLYGNWAQNEYFGTGYIKNNVPCDGVLTIFQRPIAPLYVSGVDIIAVPVDQNSPVIPEGKSLTVEAYYLNENGSIDNKLIGSGTAKAESVKTGALGSLIHFDFVEEEDGFIDLVPLVLQDKAFVIMIKGIDQCNLKVLLSGHTDVWGGSAYTIHGNDLNYFETEPGSEFNGADICLQLTGRYTCFDLLEDTNNKTIPVSGGLAADADGYNDFVIISTYAVNDGETHVQILEKSDWLTISADNTYFEDQAAVMFFIEGEALPVNLEGRAGYVKLGSYGMSCTLNVTQGDVTNISDVKLELTKAVRNGDNFDLTYPTGTNSVSILNASGQVIASYNLTSNGKFTLPTVNLTKGLYILKFEGEKTTTVKIVK